MLKLNENEIINNFHNHVFYHGTSLYKAESIYRHGFRVWFRDDETGCLYTCDGLLGNGVYITCNWKIASFFGFVILRVEILPGTRILNSSLPPDPKVIESLQKEFGRGILNKAPWDAIPKNKQLKLSELIAIFRYHYHYTWIKNYGILKDGFLKPSLKQDRHRRLMKCFKNLLVRYGFDGFGNPSDSMGIVIFSEKRVILRELVADMAGMKNIEEIQSLEEVKDFYQKNGSPYAKNLAEKIAEEYSKRANI